MPRVALEAADPESIVYIDGVRYEAVDITNDTDLCFGCCFRENIGECERPLQIDVGCGRSARADGREIIWRKHA